MSGRPVLITGGAGYVGSHVAWAMIDAGRPVVVLDDLSTGSAALVPASARLVVGSAADTALARRLVAEYGIGAVLHIAGSADVQQSFTDPGLHWRNNTLTSVAMMRIAAEARLPFLLASTAAVYAPAPATRLNEASATRPTSPYGASKLAAERMVATMARRSGAPWLALRYFNVAGADEGGRTGPLASAGGRLFKVACDAALGIGPPVPVFGRGHATADGSSVRDYIHVADLADVHVHGLTHLETGGGSGVVNCGLGRGASVLRVLAAMGRAVGRQPPTVAASPRPGDPPHVVCDDTRLRKLFPRWTPRFETVDQMAATLAAWERRRLQRAA